jgi:ABC-type molybdate transport system substrate-binding protein
VFKESPTKYEEIKVSSASVNAAKNLTAELVEFLGSNEAPDLVEGEKSTACSLNAGSLASMGSLSMSPNSVTDQSPENLFIQNPAKARSILELIFKYNRESQQVFLKGKTTLIHTNRRLHNVIRNFRFEYNI